MALTLGDNFSYQGAKPLDGRLTYNTVAEMKAVADATMYNGCLAYCVEADKTYQWKSTNTVDETLGRWREFSSGGSSGTTDYTDLNNKPTINDIELDGNKTSEDLNLASKEDMTKAYKSDDTAFTDIADGDYIPVYDTSATAKKKSLWSNIKAKLKTYFDTIYDLNKADIPYYGQCTDNSSTTAKTVTVQRGTFSLVAGAKVSVRFTNINTASAPTLNVGSTGAKNIKYITSDGTVTTPTTWWGSGDVVTFVYDGTQWLMMPTFGTLPSMPILGSINRSDIYDTTEKVIGKWTNGKPIYQKTFIGTTPVVTTDGTWVENYISVGASIDAYCELKGVAVNSSGNTVIIETASKTQGTNTAFIGLKMMGFTNSASSNANKIRIGGSSTAISAYTYYITASYTKTTDATNSYNYANENDYSTTEKIVGTWIDGSPLYQRTIEGAVHQSEPPVTFYELGTNCVIRQIDGILHSATFDMPIGYSIDDYSANIFVCVNTANTSVKKNGSITYFISNNSTVQSMTVTVRYTKTT